MIDNQVKEKIHTRLTSSYPHMWTRSRAEELFRLCGDMDPIELVRLIDAHLNNPEKGEYPPSVADIRGIEQQEERKQQLQIKNQLEERTRITDEDEWTEVEVSIPRFDMWGSGKNKGMVVTKMKCKKAKCRHCGDTGIAKFYWDTRDSLGRQVYLRTEWDQMMPEVREKIRTMTALCDCEAASPRPGTMKVDLYRLHAERLRTGYMTTIARIKQLTLQRQVDRQGTQKAFTL